jgi:methylated-DNA-protein-cysteine methyltransferase-like protein
MKQINQPAQKSIKKSINKKMRLYESMPDQSSSDPTSRTRMRIEAAIRSIPKGKVSTYGAVARAAGLPRGARQVARVLHRGFGLPWQRVLGAGGEIKLRGDSAVEQRLRLEAEGVRFRGRKVDMKSFEFKFRHGKCVAKVGRLLAAGQPKTFPPDSPNDY